ncbi:hypothetical protein BX600DRAFT_513729 [Xylariales sp. PMI_506]|nr:hypothetical protein BX600DRAFT_513729 [Xylariales sp. PMI_506]
MAFRRLLSIALIASAPGTLANPIFTIDPDTVVLSTRASWCESELNICGTVCGKASSNECNSSSLTYSCSCSDGTVPDLTGYIGSLPYFICEEAFSQCVEAADGDTTQRNECATNIQAQCGTLQAEGTGTATTYPTATTATSAQTSSADETSTTVASSTGTEVSSASGSAASSSSQSGATTIKTSTSTSSKTSAGGTTTTGTGTQTSATSSSTSIPSAPNNGGSSGIKDGASIGVAIAFGVIAAALL